MPNGELSDERKRRRLEQEAIAEEQRVRDTCRQFLASLGNSHFCNPSTQAVVPLNLTAEEVSWALGLPGPREGAEFVTLNPGFSLLPPAASLGYRTDILDTSVSAAPRKPLEWAWYNCGRKGRVVTNSAGFAKNLHALQERTPGVYRAWTVTVVWSDSFLDALATDGAEQAPEAAQ